jgi:hypothetical protein
MLGHNFSGKTGINQWIFLIYPYTIMAPSPKPSADDNTSGTEETVYTFESSGRRRDIRSTPVSAPRYSDIRAVPEGFSGGLQRDFYSIDTVEIACYFIYQQLPNQQYIEHLFNVISHQNPRWTNLEALKSLLGRVEVMCREHPDWPEQVIYETVLQSITG